MNTKVSRATRGLCCSLAALVCGGVFAGCTKYDPPHFELNMVAMVEKQIPTDQQQEIANILEAMFGTPDNPYVLPDSGLDLARIRTSAGPVKSDEFGRETGLYRRHCAHCHGTTGDGIGPTALILNPYPRDYRQGKFKFKSTERPAKPTEHDLERVLRDGVQGTAMPSFDLLPDAQIRSLVEYVKYLSLRGQTEIRLTEAMSELGEGEKLQVNRAVLVDDILKPLAESWSTAPDSIIQISADLNNEKPDTPLAESVAKGRELFYGQKANCVKCHGPSALGDGQTTDYDDWSKPIVELEKTLASEQESLSTAEGMSREEIRAAEQRIAFAHAVIATDALPPRTIVPRNLRQGIYRGGRRPIDIYRRLYAGINGAPMPGVGPASPGAQGTLTSDEIWNLVDYVLSLPYEAISQPPRQQRAAVTQAKF